MDLPESLKKRFCEDCCVPIDIYDEPIFSSRLKLFDRYFNTIERYNLFTKMLAERYTTYSYTGDVTVKPHKKGKVTISAWSEIDATEQDSVNIIFKKEETEEKPTAVTIDNISGDIYMTRGSNVYITATLEPTTLDDQMLIWESDNPKNVTVERNTGNSHLATIHGNDYVNEFKNEDISDSHTLSNVPVDPGSISIKLSKKNDKDALVTTKYTDNGSGKLIDSKKNILSEVTINYEKGTFSGLSSYKSAIVTKYTANLDKTATITVISNKLKYSGPKATIKVHVTSEVPATGLSFQYHETQIQAGNYEDVSITVSPDDCTNRDVTWLSSVPTVASVTPSGMYGQNARISALTPGECTITATDTKNAQVFDTIHVVVATAVHVEQIVLKPDGPITMKVGDISKGDSGNIDTAVVAKIFPTTASNKKVRWTSSNPSVATVEEWGFVDEATSQIIYNNVCTIHALSVGSTYIRCTSQDVDLKYSEVLLNVVPAATGVRELTLTRESGTSEEITNEFSNINESEGEASVDDSLNLKVKIDVLYGVDPTVKVKSSKQSVATVTSGEDDNSNYDSDPGTAILTAKSASESSNSSSESETEDSNHSLKFESATLQECYYYADYESIKCKLIQSVHNQTAYGTFINADTSAWKVTCTCKRSTIYSPDLDGHVMISVGLRKPLFYPLYYYNSSIFSNHSTWEDFVSVVGETDNNQIIYSENLLNQVIESCSRGRVQIYGAWLLDQFYINQAKSLVDNAGATLAYFGQDRFVVDITDLCDVSDKSSPKFSNQAMQLYWALLKVSSTYFCPHSAATKPLPLRTRLFTLYKLKTEHTSSDTPSSSDSSVILSDDIDGYVENVHYEGNQPAIFQETDPCQLPVLIRTFSYQSLQDEDRKFMHRGLMASFTDDYKVHVPFVELSNSVPDSSEFIRENKLTNKQYYMDTRFDS